MSLEALWTIQFIDAVVRGQVNGGTVVLETNRIFGGDSSYYYLGRFKTNGDNLAGEVRVVHYNGPMSTTFGTNEKDFVVQLVGARKDGVIEGYMFRKEAPQARLPFIMSRRADLP